MSFLSRLNLLPLSGRARPAPSRALGALAFSAGPERRSRGCSDLRVQTHTHTGRVGGAAGCAFVSTPRAFGFHPSGHGDREGRREGERETTFLREPRSYAGGRGGDGDGGFFSSAGHKQESSSFGSVQAKLSRAEQSRAELSLSTGLLK